MVVLAGQTRYQHDSRQNGICTVSEKTGGDIPNHSAETVNTDGGTYIAKSVHIHGGDFIGRDQHIHGDVIIGVPIEVHQLLTQYRQEVQQQYLEFWRQQVEETLSKPDYLPQPIGQIFYAEWFQKLQNEITAKEYKANQKKEPGGVKESEATQDEKDGETNPSLTKSVTFVPDKTLPSLQAIFQMLHHPQNKQPATSGLVLTGEPGAGKTVALRHLAATYAMQLIEPDRPIPIYLPLNQYDGQESISAFISSSLSEKPILLSFSQLAKRLEDILPHHRWLLLLDGFNEIGESKQDTIRHRQAFLRALQTFVRDYHVEVVISSRENAIPDIKDFQIVNLRPLDQLGIEQCLYLYAPEYAPAILQELEKQPSLRHMVANPFRAKAIAQIYRPNSNLPTTPVSLFAQLTSHLVHRETTRCQTIGSYFPPIEIWQNTVLQTAVSMHRNHTTTSTLPTTDEEQKHLAFAAQCGLLLLVTNQVVFIHQQLQEYFAALWLKAEILEENLENEYLNTIWQDSYWDETVLLLGSLLSEQSLSRLITLLAEYDPYLAARSVGQSPEKVLPTIRSWLANHLRETYDRVLGQEMINIINALGAMRCEEGFLQLVSLTNDGHGHNKETLLTAVAQYDTDAAARFIGEQLYTTVQRDWENRWYSRGNDYTIFTRALGQMKTPYARAFLIHAVQDRKLTAAALIGIAEGRFHEAIPVLREALDSSEFEAVCQTVGEAQFTPLIPDLLPYAEHYPAAMTALLRMKAGQTSINQFVQFQHNLARQYQFLSDLELLGISQWSYGNILTYYLFLEQYFGQGVAEKFLDILLAVAERSSHLRSRADAIAVLLFVRHPQLPALLAHLGIQNEGLDDYTANVYESMAKGAKLILQLPVNPGFSTNPIIRLSLRLRKLKDWTTSTGIPAEPSALLKTVALDRKQVGEWALTFLKQKTTLHEDPERIFEAMSALVELRWPEMVSPLTAATTECINLWQQIGGKDWRDPRSIAWKYVPLFVSYGEQSEAQRQQVLQAVAPQVHQPGGLWPLIAIEICTLLQGVDYLDEWLRYLRNSAWQKAYPIVDALGRLHVPPAIVAKLTQKLKSLLADERFFAVLALGEMRDMSVLPNLLTLKREPDRQVQWALIWAIGHIGNMTSGVKEFLLGAATWNNGRARMEIAHAIGQNECRDLTALLHHFLNDPDLRVVERTIWSLGILRDTSATATLTNMLNKAKRRHQMYSSNYHSHVEERLQQTLTIALVRIKQGVDIKTVTEDIPKHLSTICSGLLQAKEIYRLPNVEAQPLAPMFTAQQIALQMAHIKTLPEKEQIREIYSANIPQARLQAMDLSIAKGSLAEELREARYLKMDGAMNDPALAIRLLARKHIGVPSELEFSSRYIPESLEAGHTCVQECEDFHLNISTMEINSWFSLQLAHLFTSEFEVAELQNALLSHYPWQQPYGKAFSFLGDTLPEDALSQLTLLWRQFTKNPEHRGNSWDRNSHASLTSLARRRKWSVVPDLAQILSNATDAALDAAYDLLEMGVYQAAALIEKVMQTLAKETRNEVAKTQICAHIQAIVRVELLGATSNIIPPELLSENVEYKSIDSAFYEHLGNLLCGVDSHHPPAEWAMIQKFVLLNEYGVTDRYDAINRGLRKWGPAALTQLFDLDDTLFIQRYMREIRDLIDKENASTRDVFVQAAKEMMEDCHTYHDELFLSWLTQMHLPLQLFGLYTLAARHAPIPIETLAWLLMQANEVLVVELIRYAATIPTLQSILQAMSKEPPSFTTEIEANIAEQMVHRIVERIQVGDPQVLKLLSTYRLPQFDSHILKMLRSDNAELNDEAIKAAVKIDSLSDDKVLRQRLLLLLHSDDTSIVDIVMRYLLQAEDEELGVHLALVLKHAREEDNTEKLILSMLGITLTAYDDAAQDVIALLQHSDEEVRLIAVIACAILSLPEALPQLRENAEVLIHQVVAHNVDKDSTDFFFDDVFFDNVAESSQSDQVSKRLVKEGLVHSGATQETDDYKIPFVSKDPDSELTNIRFARAVLGDSVPLLLGEELNTQIGEGLIGFLGCSAPIVSVPNPGLISYRFLGPMLISLPSSDRYDLRWLFLTPRLWQQVVSLDLTPVEWLDPLDRQLLLASLPLVQMQFYADANAAKLSRNLPAQEEAMGQFLRQLGVENQKEFAVERFALVVQHLVNDLTKHMAKSPVLHSTISITPSTLENALKELFAPGEENNLSWEIIQDRLRTTTSSIYAFLTADQLPKTLGHQEVYLPLLGEDIADLLVEALGKTALTGRPDVEFFAELKAFGRNTLIYESIYRWGCIMMRLLHKVNNDTVSGSTYLELWVMRLAAIGFEFQDDTDKQNESGRYQKQNPLAFMFEPFRQT